jgi:hypothetical protein
MIKINSYYSLIIISVLIASLNFIYKPAITDDINMYVSMYERYQLGDYTFIQAFGRDCLVFILFFILAKLGISVSVGFFLISFFTFFNILNSVFYHLKENNINLKKEYLFYLISILPIYLSFSGIRFSLGASLIILGVILLNHSRKVGFLFLFLALLTHFSLSPFIVLYLFFGKFDFEISKTWKIIILSVFLVFFFYIMKQDLKLRIIYYFFNDTVTWSYVFLKNKISFYFYWFIKFMWIPLYIGIYYFGKKIRFDRNTWLLILFTISFLPFMNIFYRYTQILCPFLFIILFKEFYYNKKICLLLFLPFFMNFMLDFYSIIKINYTL